MILVFTQNIVGSVAGGVTSLAATLPQEAMPDSSETSRLGQT